LPFADRRFLIGFSHCGHVGVSGAAVALRASTRAVDLCRDPANWDAATDAAMRISRAPAIRRESVKLQWEATIPRLFLPTNPTRRIGWTAEADWTNCIDLLLRTGAITTPIPANTVYTTEFLPT
jgi:hypothetical protein